MTTTETNNTNNEEKVEIVGSVERMSDPRFYELFYILRPGLSEEELRALENEIRTAIGDLKGIIVEEHAAESRGLAFSLGKFDEAARGSMKFMLKPEEIRPLERSIKKIKELVRLRINTTSKETQAPRRSITKSSDESGEVKSEELEKKLEEILG